MVTEDITDRFREVQPEELERLEREFLELGAHQFAPIQEGLLAKIRDLMEGVFDRYRHTLPPSEIHDVVDNVYQRMVYHMEKKYIELRRQGKSSKESFEEATGIMWKLIERADAGSTNHVLFRVVKKHLERMAAKLNPPPPVEYAQAYHQPEPRSHTAVGLAYR